MALSFQKHGLTTMDNGGEPIRVLLVDDDQVLSSLLSEYLQTEGCFVDTAEDGIEASNRVQQQTFDIMVLDIMMPKLNGIDTLKSIRTHSAIPVIMLTARGDDLDRILGLELGADDYVAKPCNPRELFARIKAVLRRSQPSLNNEVSELTVGQLTASVNSRRVIDHGNEVVLTQTEFDMLWLLLLRPEQIISKADFSLKVLGKPLSQWDRSVDVHISNLRKKLAPNNKGVERIKTLRGSGYCFLQEPT